MNNPDQRELCRIFYMTKGHLNVTIDTIEKCYDSYYKRLWNNNEAYLKEEGFESSYKDFVIRNEKYLGKSIAKKILNRVNNG